MGVLKLTDAKGMRSPGRDIYTVNFADYLPETLKRDPKIKALATAVTEQMLGVSAEIDNVLIYSRMDELPEELIDILAFDMHIDWYDYSYPLATKRDILKNSVKVHKKMGTVYAIQTALRSLYPEVKVIEWFEYEGKPYTFRVEINVTDFYETVENKNKIVKIINMYKRLSAHLEFIIYRIVVLFKIEIKYDAAITYISTFYPRSNAVLLFLDGTSGLDGIYQINGYKGGKCIDFYPTNLLVNGAFRHNLKLFEYGSFLLNAKLSVKEEAVIWMKSDFYPRCNLPLFRLDGTQFLDGTHTLNEMDQDFESLFLNGSGCLNGEYITNGYMDCHNFDFYPLQIDIQGEYKQKSVVSGFIHPITYAKLLPKSGLLLNVIGSVKKEVRTEEICLIEGSIGKIDVSLNERLVVEKDLYFLDGEQRLDGTVCLDADIYEVVL